VSEPLDIIPGVDCRLRLIAIGPLHDHELGKFDCDADARRAERAAESAVWMLSATLAKKERG